MIDSIIFDLDGTLWDATGSVIDCWNDVISRCDDVDRPFTLSAMQSGMGLPTDVIGKHHFPELSTERGQEIMNLCFQAENVYLAEHGGKLYPGTLAMLTELSKKLPLYIVSNCQKGYIEAFYKGNGTGGYFSGHACYEDAFLPKGENIRALMERYGLNHPIYVGDTQGDCDASANAGIPFVFAAYGFGSVDRSDAVIHTPLELCELVSGMQKN